VSRKPPHRTAIFLVVGALACLATAGVASAHGGPGDIDVGDPQVVDALTIEFPIRITYQNDGHAAEDVEGLVVSGSGPDGASFGPIDAFTRGDAPGVFIARVELPAEGTWELLIEASEPPSTASLTADATGPPVVAPADDPDAEPPVGAAPPGDPDAPAVVDDDPARADDVTGDAADVADTGDDDGDDSNVALIIVAVLVFAVVAGLGYALTRRSE
jgi:hypothetical protein